MNSVQSEEDGLKKTSERYAPPTEAQPIKTEISRASRHTGRSLWLMRKNVLLVDVDATSRASRSRVMRALGVNVSCVATVTGAWQKLESSSYNLVLVDLGSDVVGAESFAEEVRAKNSRQLVAFLVGSPLFVARSYGGKASPLSAISSLPDEPEQKRERPLSPAFDFGQKVRDAEAKKVS